MAVRANGTDIPGTVIVKSSDVDEETVLNGTFLATLAAGDVVDISLESSAATTVNFGDGTTAILILEKIAE